MLRVVAPLADASLVSLLFFIFVFVLVDSACDGSFWSDQVVHVITKLGVFIFGTHLNQPGDLSKSKLSSVDQDILDSRNVDRSFVHVYRCVLVNDG